MVLFIIPKRTSELSVGSINNQSIVATEKKQNLLEYKPNVEINKVDQAIDLVWGNIRLGDANFKLKKYKEAAICYQKALDVDVWTGGGCGCWKTFGRNLRNNGTV